MQLCALTTSQEQCCAITSVGASQAYVSQRLQPAISSNLAQHRVAQAHADKRADGVTKCGCKDAGHQAAGPALGSGHARNSGWPCRAKGSRVALKNITSLRYPPVVPGHEASRGICCYLQQIVSSAFPAMHVPRLCQQPNQLLLPRAPLCRISISRLLQPRTPDCFTDPSSQEPQIVSRTLPAKNPRLSHGPFQPRTPD